MQNFSRAYEALDGTTKEMRKGRENRTEGELDFKMAQVELQHKLDTLRKEFDAEKSANRAEVAKSADSVRADMVKFIEKTKTLFERLADKMKVIEQQNGGPFAPPLANRASPDAAAIRARLSPSPPPN